jgi:hypothetical protein
MVHEVWVQLCRLDADGNVHRWPATEIEIDPAKNINKLRIAIKAQQAGILDRVESLDLIVSTSESGANLRPDEFVGQVEMKSGDESVVVGSKATFPFYVRFTAGATPPSLPPTVTAALSMWSV